MNETKMLWRRFQQCLGASAILLVEESSETGHFRHLSNNVLGVRKFWNTNAKRVIFFSKCLKCNVDFKNVTIISEKVFCFWDNRIWTGIIKLSLLRTGYFPSAANVLTSSTKIFQFNRGEFFLLNWPGSDQWLWWPCCDADLNSSLARLPCFLSKDPLKRDFLEIYLTTFFEGIILEIINLWGSSFVKKYLKFKMYFKNRVKNWQKCFVSDLISSQLVLLNGLYSDEDAFHQQPIC